MSSGEILNILLGGGLITLVIGIITLKATLRKANADAERAKAEAERAKAEAERAKADAESVRITNTENATRILVENIVKPLKDELSATRDALHSTQEELVLLRKAVEGAKSCDYAADCPVVDLLRNGEKNTGTTVSAGDTLSMRQHGHRNKADPDRKPARPEAGT